MNKRLLNIPRCTVIALLALMTTSLFAQHPILEGFTLKQTGSTMRVDFAIKGGASCNGVTLERDDELGNEFIKVDQISGVCGGSEFTEFYVMEDAAPLPNRIGYYRLILGAQGYSDTLSVLFVPPNAALQAYPNPFNSFLDFQWEGANNEEWRMQWFNLAGEEVLPEQQVRAPRVRLTLPDLQAGVYIVVLRHPIDHRSLQLRVVKSNSAP